jgi:hypothetical protein
MKSHSAPASTSFNFSARPLAQRADGGGDAKHPVDPGGLSRFAPYIAFFVILFASMAAAAAVVSSDAPLMLVGLY